ncbi:MAG: hypothetical protein AAGL10_15860 [Pseudomonadota bacterium]
MMQALSFLAVASLATSPIPLGDDQEGRTLTMSLCDGGKITIPIDGNGEDHERDCQSMACHAATCREKEKRVSKPNLI